MIEDSKITDSRLESSPRSNQSSNLAVFQSSNPLVVEIPGLLKVYTGGRAEVEGEGRDVGELLEDLERKFPGLTSHFLNEHSELSNMANVFVNEIDFHLLAGLKTLLSDGDRVRLAVAPLVSGGSGYDR